MLETKRIPTESNHSTLFVVGTRTVSANSSATIAIIISVAIIHSFRRLPATALASCSFLWAGARHPLLQTRILIRPIYLSPAYLVVASWLAPVPTINHTLPGLT